MLEKLCLVYWQRLFLASVVPIAKNTAQLQSLRHRPFELRGLTLMKRHLAGDTACNKAALINDQQCVAGAR